MEWFFDTLRKYPELAIFLTLGLGYWIGSKKIFGFNLGAVTGTLLVGVLVGQLNISIAPILKQVFFLLFLFGLGYGVGPQFFRGMKSDGLPQVIFAVIICVLCLLVTWVTAIGFGFDAGTAAGLLSGAQTISAVMGVATDTINGLSVDAATKKQWIDSIPVAYAVCYIFGTVGSAWLLASLGPKLMRVDIVKECREYEAKMSGGADSMELSGYRKFTARAYRLDNAEYVGKTVGDLEARFVDARVFVERIRRGDQIIDAESTTALQAGDVLGVTGRHDALVLQASGLIGTEVEDRDVINLPAEVVEVVLTNKNVAGKTLKELAENETVRQLGRGVFLRKVVRGGHEMPVNWGLKLDRGDRLFVLGAKRDVERVVGKLGYVDRATNQTDMVFVGFGILLGGLFGTLVLTVGGIPITLSTSGGALISGLVFGYLRSVHPTFGRVPEPVHWFLTSVGLTAFVAVVGIVSGPGFVQGFQQLGAKLFIAGVIATSVPMILGVFIARYVFKFHPAIALGVCAGARTTTAAIGQITETAKSQVPALGYTVPYAIGNTLLIIWGIVIVLLMA